jgi:CubicO group peptidase (beta-lactamase class C family)
MSDCDLQAVVQDAIDERMSSGNEIAAQVCVVHDGEVVVDAVAAAEPTTLFWSASASKGVVAALAHVLVERGALDYDRPVVHWWPEFGEHGKGATTLRHVLLHQAGVPGLPATITVEQLCDWQYVCATLADAEPWWAPGTRMGYHALTYGFLVGELVRRATGLAVGDALREVITGPLGIADEVFFGVPHRLLPAVAPQVRSPEDSVARPAPGSAVARAIPVAVLPDAEFANRRDALTADIPSVGTATARGLARLYAALLDGSLVSEARLRDIAAVHVRGRDEVMEFDIRLAFGFSPDRPAVPSRPGSSFGMPGANGSVAYADIDTGVAVAVTRNRFSLDHDLAGTIDTMVAAAFPDPEVHR